MITSSSLFLAINTEKQQHKNGEQETAGINEALIVVRPNKIHNIGLQGGPKSKPLPNDQNMVFNVI